MTAERSVRLHRVLGIAVSAMGVLWLAKKAGWMPADHVHPAFFWPIVVTAAGLFLLFGARRSEKGHR